MVCCTTVAILKFPKKGLDRRIIIVNEHTSLWKFRPFVLLNLSLIFEVIAIFEMKYYGISICSQTGFPRTEGTIFFSLCFPLFISTTELQLVI